MCYKFSSMDAFQFIEAELPLSSLQIFLGLLNVKSFKAEICSNAMVIHHSNKDPQLQKGEKRTFHTCHTQW